LLLFLQKKKTFFPALPEPRHAQRQKHRQHRGVQDVDEERADDRHDQERLRRRAVASGDGCMLAIAVAVAPIAKPQNAADITALS
jgi:hypothetical protein